MRLTRRNVLQGASALTMASAMPLGRFGTALAATEEERIIAAAKTVGGADLSGMIWSNYFVGMQPSMEVFKGATGIGVGGIQDISIFDIPQRAMAEALSRSPQFDFFHVDSNMIPSLASAGLLEPLDEYMQASDFKIEAVGDYANFMTYKGNTYGVPTDGNVHVQYIRKDLFENPELQKKFEDQHGEPMKWPETWEQDHRLMTFFHDPDNEIWGSCNLRNRANGATWWYQIFYSAGGFPFDDDMNPTLNTDAGKYAVEWYLKEKEAGHPESPGWGTPQMIPRMTQGNAAMCQYWDGIIPLNENPEASKTVGKWLYGLVPGSDLSGKRVYRSVSSPLAAVLVNRYSPRKAQAAYLALYWGTLENSAQIVGDRVNTFHDPWHRGHIEHPAVVEAYTAEGMAAVKQNLEVVAPPVYMTGYLEFQDTLAKNLSEAYVGQLPADQVLPRTEEEWGRIIKRTGASRLKEELDSYKTVMPSVDKPSSM